MLSLEPEKSACKCEVLKRAEAKKLLDIKGDQKSDVLFLLTYPYPSDFLALYYALLRRHGYTLENSAFVHSLGCIPFNRKIKNSSDYFVKCKKQNIAKKIKRIAPKVIVTEGLALYTIVEDTYVTYEHFYNRNLPTTFWCPEFNCWVIPMPSINDWIGVTAKNPNLRVLNNYPKHMVDVQLKTIKFKRTVSMRKSKVNVEMVEDPISFLKEAINNKAIEKIAVDIETTSLLYFSGKILSIQFSWDGRTGYFIQWQDTDEFKRLLNEFLKGKYLIGANCTFDSRYLKHNGIKDIAFSSDVNYLGHFIYSARGNSLKANTFYHTDMGGYELTKDSFAKRYGIKKRFDLLPTSVLKDYAACDTIATFRLEPTLLKFLNEDQKKLFFETYMPLAKLFVDIELKGMYVDQNYLKLYREKCETKIEEIEFKIKQRFPGKSLKSDDQVGEMFEKLGAKCYGGKNENDKFRTGANILKKWVEDGIPFAADMLEFRENHQLVKTYLSEKAKLSKNIDPADGRVHASFNFQRNWVSRLSCNDPNLQNLPIKGNPEFRPIFKAPPGYYLAECDFSGFHLRLVAMESGDPVLRKMFTSDTRDMHSKTASIVFTTNSFEDFLFKLKKGTDEEKKRYKMFRNMVKEINFGLIYGMSYMTLAHEILKHPPPKGWVLGRVDQYLEENNIKNIEDLQKYLGIKSKNISRDTELNLKYEACAKSIRDKFFTEYAGLERWIEYMRKEGSKKGYVDTMYGFRIWIPEFAHPYKEGREKVVANLKNVSVNGRIIGTEANIMQRAQLQIADYFKQNNLDAHIVNQVHDSLVVEFRKDLLNVIRDPIKEIMTRDYPEYKGIPLDAEGSYGKVWGGYERMKWHDWF